MNANKKKWFFFLLTGFAMLNSYSQKPALYFKRLTQSNGLSNNKVNCILQDKRGFIWIGTDDGLNRYDGNNFVVFKNTPGQASGISGNTITDLHEDKDEVLWIATSDGGITKYDRRLQHAYQFRQFKHHPNDQNSIPVNIINALQQDHEGNLWLATSGAGVLRFDKKKERFEKPAGIGPWTINDICVDKNGILWGGREGGSIIKINPLNLHWQIDEQYSNVYAALPHVVVTSLFKDSKNNIWFGSWDKAVYRYNNLNGKEDNFSNKKNDSFSFGIDEPISFNEDKMGRIWIGGKYSGLYIYEPIVNKFYNYRHDPAKEGTLSADKINCIFMDVSGNAWLGTDRGISIYQAMQQQFEQEFLPFTGDIREKPIVIYDFYKDEAGTLWIGTNKGLFLKGTDGRYIYKKIVYLETQLSITRIYKTPEGDIYLGTDYSLFRYDPVKSDVSLLPNTEKDQVMSKLIESRIVSIVLDTIDGHPVLLTSPYGHFISYYNFTEQRWISRKDSTKKILTRYNIRDNLIRKIFKSGDGTLWLANVKHGLAALNKNGQGNTTYINDPSRVNSISNNNIFDIKEDKLGNLWISTYGGGLNYFEKGKKTFKHIESVNNLVEGMETDKNGNIWSITNGNLQKFDPLKNSFSYFELPDIEKSGGIKGYIYKDGQGKMYVSGAGYFISFQPEEINVKPGQPEVFLTDFNIFNQSYSHLLMQKEVALSYKENFFTIHFSAPFYTGTASLQYAYMLEGVDNDWINAGSSTQAPYTNLSGGEYIFKVKATETPGSWSDKVTTINIRIVPAFWKRWWFFAIVSLLLFFIIYGIYRYRINELYKRQSIRNKIAQDLHDSVGSTLSSISVYSQVAKFYNEQEKQSDLTNTLEKISSASGEMISELSDTVWAINPLNDHMDIILQRMESFARPLLSALEINFHFYYDESLMNVNLEMTKRKNFYLIFKEAVNNVIKYAACKNLWVRLEYHNHELTFTIKDDGRGYDMALVKSTHSLSGNGLQNMKHRAKEMEGTLIIQSSQGNGTSIKLQFPIP